MFGLLCGSALVDPVWAFNSCITSVLDSRPSQLPMDGSDPVVVGTNVYMAYTTGNEVDFLTSHDSGLTFARHRLDRSNQTSPAHVHIAALGARVYVTWVATVDTVAQVFFRLSTDHGNNFSPAIALGVSGDFSPHITVSGLGVSVDYGTTSNFVVASSQDGGVTWPNSPAFALQGSVLGEGWVARLGETIVAGWSEVNPSNPSERPTYVETSVDGGATYTVSQLSTIPKSGTERQVEVSSTTGIFYIAATDLSVNDHLLGGNQVLWTSLDSGTTWTEQVLAPGTDAPMMAVKGSTVYLTWRQNLADGTSFIALDYSLDSGQTWATPIDLSGPVGYPSPVPDMTYLPALSLTGGLFSEVYESQGSVFVRSSGDISKGISMPINLGPGTNAMIGGKNVLWLGPATGQNQAIYYARCS